MRAVLLLLSVAVLAGCQSGGSENTDCLAPMHAFAPVFQPYLLSPTIEERAAGPVGIVTARLESISYSLPDRTKASSDNLGTVSLEFAVLEHLKAGRYETDTVRAHMDVGYDCVYSENDDRDRKALARLSARLEEFFDGKLLVMFLPKYGSAGLYFPRATVSYSKERYYEEPIELEYRMWSHWNDGSQWLLLAEGVGSSQSPHFVDPLDAALTVDVPEHTISLAEIRERLYAVMAEEEEKGIDCVGALYMLQHFIRSGEEPYYYGELKADGTPVECS